MEEAVSEDMTAHADRRCSAKRSKTCTNTAKTETKAGEKKTKEKKFTAKGQTSKVSSEF